jgi:hypothetical protein
MAGTWTTLHLFLLKTYWSSFSIFKTRDNRHVLEGTVIKLRTRRSGVRSRQGATDFSLLPSFTPAVFPSVMSSDPYKWGHHMGSKRRVKKTPCDGERISLINKGLKVMPPQRTFLDWLHMKAPFVVLIDKLFCIFKTVFLHSSTTLVCLSLLQLRFSSSHSVIHATDSMTLDEGSARRRDNKTHKRRHLSPPPPTPPAEFFSEFLL